MIKIWDLTTYKIHIFINRALYLLIMNWKLITEQNPWWSNKLDNDIVEKYSTNIIKIERKNIDLDKGKVYFIKGPRRTGKTIYLKLIANKNLNCMYLNFDILNDVKFSELEQNIKIYAERYDQIILLLDEIQSFKDWKEFLKALYDLGRFKSCTVIITGSDPREIEKGRQKMIGRSEETQIMAPLCFRDFLLNVCKTENKNLYDKLIANEITLKNNIETIKIKYINLDAYFDEIEKYFNIYLLTGGFPETINDYIKNLKTGAAKINSTYYEDIIEKIFEKMNKKISIDILKVIVDSITNTLKYSTIKNKTKYSEKTIKWYLNEMSELMLLFEIKEKQSNKLKKFYIKDPFIMHSIRTYYTSTNYFEDSFNTIMDEREKGIFVENCVAGHLHNLYNWNLEFYRDEKQKEVDFIVNKTAIEVKYRTKIEMPTLIKGVEEYILLTRFPVGLADLQINNRLAIPSCVFLAMLQKPLNFL